MTTMIAIILVTGRPGWLLLGAYKSGLTDSLCAFARLGFLKAAR
jgi:hypothetical protein